MSYTVYVLELRRGKFYVGMTQKPVDERIAEHAAGEGTGAAWTKLHGLETTIPYEVHACKTYAEAQQLELRKTAELCFLHGLDAVRGANYCMINPDLAQKRAQATSIAYLLRKNYDDVYAYFSLPAPDPLPRPPRPPLRRRVQAAQAAQAAQRAPNTFEPEPHDQALDQEQHRDGDEANMGLTTSAGAVTTALAAAVTAAGVVAGSNVVMNETRNTLATLHQFKRISEDQQKQQEQEERERHQRSLHRPVPLTSTPDPRVKIKPRAAASKTTAAQPSRRPVQPPQLTFKTTGSAFKCFACGQVGHFASACPSKFSGAGVGAKRYAARRSRPDDDETYEDDDDEVDSLEYLDTDDFTFSGGHGLSAVAMEEDGDSDMDFMERSSAAAATASKSVRSARRTRSATRRGVHSLTKSGTFLPCERCNGAHVAMACPQRPRRAAATQAAATLQSLAREDTFRDTDVMF